MIIYNHVVVVLVWLNTVVKQSDSSDIHQDSKNSSFWGSSSSDSAIDCPSQAWGASFAPPTHGVAPPPGPIPLPTVAPFTLPVIKNATDYLQTRELILYWLRCPGYSTARSDSALITDSRKALVSQFWEVHIRTALKDGGMPDSSSRMPVQRIMTRVSKCFRFSKTTTALHPSNTFTTLLSLFNDTQNDTKGIHEFRLRFEGNLLVLSHSSVTIPQIL